MNGEDLKSIAIDTNILLILIAYETIEIRGLEGPAALKVLNDVWGQRQLGWEEFRRLFAVCRSARRRVVTQHVDSEVFSQRDKLRFDRETLEKAVLGVADGMEKIPCSLQDLYTDSDYRKILLELGPADAGLIWVAQQNRLEILSVDRKLAQFAQGRSVNVFSIQDLRSV